MTHTTTRQTHHRLVTSITAVTLLLTAGCTPSIGGVIGPPNNPKPPPMKAIVAGGTGLDRFDGVAVASDGSIIAVGQTTSADGDFPPSHGAFDAVIVKYGPDGTQQWAKTIGGSDDDGFSGVAVAGDGSIIAVGATASTDGDLAPAHGNGGALIVKYSPDGTQQWAQIRDSAGFKGVVVASDGTIIAVGTRSSADGAFPPTHGDADSLIVKYSPDGTQQWAKTTWGTNGDDFTRVAVTSDGGIIAVGYANPTDGDFPPVSDQRRAFIARFGSDGTQQWTKTAGGSDDGFFDDVAVVSDGGIIAAGATSSRNGDVPLNQSFYDALIVKYGPDGTKQWTKTTGGSDGDFFRGVAAASDGSISAVGETFSIDGDFPPSHRRTDIVTDVLIVKYGPDGTQYWAKTSGGPDSDSLAQVTVTSGGSIIAVGETSSEEGDFPPLHGYMDALLVIISPEM